MNGYNGWKNWETWNMALWCDNEEPIYRARVSAKRFITNWTSQTAQDFCLQHFPNGTPDFDTRGEIDVIDWQEIADSWNAE